MTCIDSHHLFVILENVEEHVTSEKVLGLISMS